MIDRFLEEIVDDIYIDFLINSESYYKLLNIKSCILKKSLDECDENLKNRDFLIKTIKIIKNIL